MTAPETTSETRGSAPPPSAELGSVGSTVGAWISSHPGTIASIIGGLVGATFAAGQAVGTLTAPTRVDRVETQVESLTTNTEALRTQVESLTTNTEALRTQLASLVEDPATSTTASSEVTTLRAQVESLTTNTEALRTQVESLTTNTEALRTQLASLVEDPATPTTASSEDAILRAHLEARTRSAIDGVEALGTQLKILVETPGTSRAADVAGLRVLAESLAARLATAIASNDVESLRAIIECSIAETEDIRRFLDDIGAGRRTLRLTVEERCRQFLQ